MNASRFQVPLTVLPVSTEDNMYLRKDGEVNLLEKAIKFAAKTQQDEQSAQVSLFGGSSGIVNAKTKNRLHRTLYRN